MQNPAGSVLFLIEITVFITISRRGAERMERLGMKMKSGSGDCLPDSLSLQYVGFPLCCFLFEPFAFKEHCVQARNKAVQIWIHLDWSLFSTDASNDPSEVFSPPRLLYPSCLSHCLLLILFLSVSSCPMAPARRPCPTASASPPSSARTRRPPFTTPPGCGFSRSGSGPALPPSSRPPKSSPQSVPFIFYVGE